MSKALKSQLSRATFVGGFVLAAQLVSASPGSAKPMVGLWGGDRLQLTLTPTGGRLEGDCVSGSFSGPVLPDAQGKFLAVGSFQEEHGGGQRADLPAAPANIRDAGEIHESLMTLSIQTDESARVLQFTLRQGVKVKLVRCL